MDGGQVGLATRMAADIRALAAIPRPPASAGEHAAAGWLRERLAGLGLSAEIESFRFNPDYGVIWGSHLLVASVAASLPLFFGQQLAVAGAIVAAIVAISVWGELTARFRLLGSLFPKRVSWNVLARSGNRAASATLLIGAHHDAARSGSAFHPWLIARGRGSPPPLYILFIAILIVTVAASMSAIGAGGAGRRSEITDVVGPHDIKGALAQGNVVGSSGQRRSGIQTGWVSRPRVEISRRISSPAAVIR